MMSAIIVHLEKAQPVDVPALQETLALLRRVELPEEGVGESFADFILARRDGRLAGCVGLERHGSRTLLRSLAVAPEHQGEGLGQRLTERAIGLARENRVAEIVLLTTTAAEFFQHHFKFAPVNRAGYDAVFADSIEWRLPRCASAVCLALKLEAGK